MKYIKKTGIHYFLSLLFISIFSTGVLSEDMQNNDITIYDIHINFPILKNLYESGYFNLKRYNINLMNHREDEHDINLKGIRLVSNIRKDNGRDYSIFNLYSRNSHQTVKFTWEVPLEDAEENFYHKPVARLLDLAIEAREKEINELICENVSRGYVQIIGQDTNENGEGTDAPAYDLKIKEGPSPRHRFFRTLGELFFINSFGVINYWVNKDENMEDWEYKPTREGFRRKITDGWSLDTNAFRTNTIYHIYAGTIYYQTARSNEYGFLASVAWAFTGSLIWEYIGEFREQVSTNDMIFTTMGGTLCGEALRQVSLHLEEALPDGFFRYFMITVLDPMRIINRAIDRWLYDDIDVRMTFINPVQAVIFNSLGAPGGIAVAGVNFKW